MWRPSSVINCPLELLLMISSAMHFYIFKYPFFFYFINLIHFLWCVDKGYRHLIFSAGLSSLISSLIVLSEVLKIAIFLSVLISEAYVRLLVILATINKDTIIIVNSVSKALLFRLTYICKHGWVFIPNISNTDMVLFKIFCLDLILCPGLSLFLVFIFVSSACMRFFALIYNILTSSHEHHWRYCIEMRIGCNIISTINIIITPIDLISYRNPLLLTLITIYRNEFDLVFLDRSPQTVHIWIEIFGRCNDLPHR